MSAASLIAELKDKHFLDVSKDVQLAIIAFENEGATSERLEAFAEAGYTEIAEAIQIEARLSRLEWIATAPSEEKRLWRIAYVNAKYNEEFTYE